MTFLTSGSLARSSSDGRKDHLVEPSLLGLKPRGPRQQAIEIFGDDREIGLGDGVIEPHHDIAGLDQIAVMRAQFADDAAGRMLDLLDAGFDHDRSRRDQRTRRFRPSTPSRRAHPPAARPPSGRRSNAAVSMSARPATCLLPLMVWHSAFADDLDRGWWRDRCNTWPNTVSLGPNACMRPSFSTRS